MTMGTPKPGPAEPTDRWRDPTLMVDVDRAISEAGATKEYATPDAALRWLLELAWGDLQVARHDALNGHWSMACDNQVCRIIGLTRLIGPLSWEHVQIDLILDGIYEQIHAAIGTPTPLSDDDRQRARATKEAR